MMALYVLYIGEHFWMIWAVVGLFTWWMAHLRFICKYISTKNSQNEEALTITIQAGLVLSPEVDEL